MRSNTNWCGGRSRTSGSQSGETTGSTTASKEHVWHDRSPPTKRQIQLAKPRPPLVMILALKLEGLVLYLPKPLKPVGKEPLLVHPLDDVADVVDVLGKRGPLGFPNSSNESTAFVAKGLQAILEGAPALVFARVLRLELVRRYCTPSRSLTARTSRL